MFKINNKDSYFQLWRNLTFVLVFLLFYNILYRNALLWFVKDYWKVLFYWPWGYNNNILGGTSLFKVAMQILEPGVKYVQNLELRHLLLTSKIFHTLF